MAEADKELALDCICRDVSLKRVKQLHTLINDALRDSSRIPRVHASYEFLVKNITQFERSHFALMSHSSNANNFEQLDKEEDEFQQLVLDIKVLYASPPFTNQDVTLSSQDAQTTALIADNTHSAPMHYARLPKLELPRFHGTISEWPSFYDLFVTSIHNNTSLTPVQKFQHLKSILQGEPLLLIRNLPLTDANYDSALSLLVERYERKRLISSYHLQALLELPKPCPMNFQRASSFLNSIKEHMSALKAVNEPVQDWSRLITFILVGKFDPHTRSKFERTIIRDELPELESLYDFLQGIINAHQWETVIPTATDAHKHERKAVVRLPPNATSHSASTNQRRGFSSFVTTSTPNSCSFCSAQHPSSACDTFLAKSPQQRAEAVRKAQLCLNCLRSTHTTSTCTSRYNCRKCQRRHHTLLHFGSRQPAQSPSDNFKSPPPLYPNVIIQHGTPPDETIKSSTPVTPLASLHSTNPFSISTVLLGTALVHVADDKGNWIIARALLDSGSEASYLTSEFASRLNKPITPSSVIISGFSNNTTTKVDGSSHLRLRSRYDKKLTFWLNVLIVPTITCSLPQQQVSDQLVKQFSHLPLADPHFTISSPIDMLIGADLYYYLFTGRKIQTPNSPLAIETKLGWIVSGRVSNNFSNHVHSYLTHSNDALSNAITQFWQTEEITTKPQISKEHQRAENLFSANSSRDTSGRYVVPLLFKNFPPLLGNSYHIAFSCYNSLVRRLQQNPTLREAYMSFMTEYQELGHMSQLEHDQRQLGYYLPHHGVLRNANGTQKLRVVFNGSKPTSNSTSLNDTMLTGPALQTDITAVITRFRRFAYVFTADVRHMYRQILVQPEHRIYQKILWSFDLSVTPSTYVLNTVTYGTSCAPFLAIRTLRQLAIDYQEAYPLASKVLMNDIFVDDIATGADSISQIIFLRDQVIALLQEAGLQLRKWTSNNPKVLDGIPIAHLEPSTSSLSSGNNAYKILGVLWNSQSDYFSYEFTIPPVSNSKRTILAQIAKIYDPLGWLTPSIFVAKHLIQQIWKSGLDWDDIIPQNLLSQWNTFRNSLPSLSAIQIPRHLSLSSHSVDMIGFCDASQIGYAAVVYLRCSAPDSQPKVHLLAAKSRVAPLKTISIPRLELSAALLLTRLMANLHNTCELFIQHFYAWTDSTVTLAWIRSEPFKWNTFVSNRVSEIQSNLPTAVWNHVSSHDNPADCASRGLLPDALVSQHLWWNGPEWLLQESSNWPTTSPVPLSPYPPEAESEAKCTFVTRVANDNSLLQRYSSLTTLIRITSLCVRFIQRCARLPDVPSSFITAHEMNASLLLWITVVQSQAFHNDLMNLQTGHLCSPKLQRLTPFIDDQGIIRVGGRLQQANISYDRKHPILLPARHIFTNLLIDSYHLQYLHPSPRTLQAILANRFWILSARQVIRSRSAKCITCFRCKPAPVTPLMGQLPAHRVSPCKPFDVAGVDYGGPFFITPHKGRGIKASKAYLCLFICFATKAVHLELAPDLTTQSFINAFQRFLARRGQCSHLYSDSGTNFVGAKRYLTELQAFVSSRDFTHSLTKHFSSQGLEWHLNPPSAPHFGGLWEAGIKSVKFHLIRVVGNRILTYEEMLTVLCQVESILNSRPLCPMSNDPNDLDFLSPNHFLNQSEMTCLPNFDLSTPEALLSRWQLVQRVHTDFWKRWHSDYLSTLQQRTKWFKTSPNIAIGSLVLVHDKNCPPLTWKLGRIESVFPGPDHVTRVASVKLSSGKITRPIIKLCPLPGL